MPAANVPDDLRARLDYDDGRLLAECDVHTFRASGPGGQHRNKTSSAVRLYHRPSGLTVKAAESRSQHENKASALRRLRVAIAIRFRLPLSDQVQWPPNVTVADRRLKVAPHNPSVPHALALALDALFAYRGALPDAAAWLGITPSSLTRFVAQHSAAWAEANQIRRSAGLASLRP
jgi:hypothetical protein